ncbi:unnamed protein product, partial [Mesorhabditis spiculigera]
MPGVDSEFQMTSQGDDDGLLLSLVKPGEHITLDLTASSVVDQHSQLTRRYHDKWTVTKEIDSAEAVCEFLNRLLIALPPHAVHFHCGPMTGQTALFYREHLDVMRSPMRVTHFQTSVDVLVPRLSDERRLSRQPYEPGYRPIDIIETLGTKIGINDRIEIYRCTTVSL